MKAKAPPTPLRILMLIEEGLNPPESIEGLNEEQIAPFKTEWDVWTALKKMGHEVQKLELHNELGPVRDAITQLKPQIAFNLMEGFRGNPIYDQHVVSYLELIEQPYTGCNPRGMTLARDKALTKKIMAYHRIRVPAFAVFARGRAITRPKKLAFPLLVKSVSVEGSIGISQASIVHDDEKLKERVKFIHDSLQTFAIAEQFIEGRELYVGVMGNLRLQTLPIWELVFEKVPEDQPRIATRRSKFNAAYQKKWGITSRAAQDLPLGIDKELPHLCRRIYRILGLTGYARLDFRLTPTGELYLLEANPNPQIANQEDFADSAKAAGIEYEALLGRIIQLGLSYRPEALC